MLPLAAESKANNNTLSEGSGEIQVHMNQMRYKKRRHRRVK